MKMIKYLNFIHDYIRFKRKGNSRFQLNRKDWYPCLNDKTMETEFDRHYLYHPAWAARILSFIKPREHVDISSILHFSSIVSAFIPVKFYDYRPADMRLSNLYSAKANLLSLPFENNSVLSLSCMHAVEHIGLGRYGEALDTEGDIKAIKELIRVISPGGSLLFVVPIGGKSKIMFNAHRIYTLNQISQYFSKLRMKEFALIPENPKDGGLVINPSKKLLNKQSYGCGCFWFIK